MKRNIATMSGFTLVELILAIGFVSLLLLAVSVLTIRVGDMYEKGATVRSINQVSRELVDVMRRDFAQSTGGVELVETGTATAPIYRLCLGDVSYIANSAALLTAREEDGSAVRVVTKVGADSGDGVHMVRIADKGKSLCRESAAGASEYPSNVDESATELLTGATMVLAVHNMSLQRVADGSDHELYRFSILIGTNKIGTLDDDIRCRINSDRPEDAGADYNYCSVAELTTIMKTGGES